MTKFPLARVGLSSGQEPDVKGYRLLSEWSRVRIPLGSNLGSSVVEHLTP